MTTPAFDLLGPLPEGTTVLEASAGTGKTFTIAGLVTRYVAEGRARLDELLVVTFGRAATQELRDRVRERLVSARDGLTDPAAARASADPLLVHLAGTDADMRRRRLAEALASFDSATVATTHEFCHQVLHGLGAVGDVDAAAVLIENLDDLTVEVVQDLYLRMWSRDNAAAPPMTYDAAVALAKAVVRDAQAVLVPEHAVPDSPPDVRRRFAVAVRAEVERRKRARYLLSFDDLLTRLQTTLADPRSGAAAAGRLRARYRVVLVDEFQDTDPVQWDILRLAFHGHTTLVLIGDPKQAIYAFRGADVHAYLAAADLAEQRATLTENWRSDPDLLRGLDALFRGAALGDRRIVVQPVSAAHSGRSLDVADAPVRIRVLPERPKVMVDQARRSVTADVVREIVDLLDAAPILTPRDGPGPRPVQPGDLAVIVRSGVQLDLVHAALIEAGVPSVQRTTSSVFRTPAGADWIVLLEALEQPHRTARVRRLALTPFVGWDAERLDTEDLDPLALRVRHWITVAEQRGIAALLETVSRDQRVPSRLLGELDGERRLTDLRHVGEALHAATMAGQLGLTAGLEWLRRRVDEARDDSSTERSRRLDSDAAAVQVVTVHASKGLEFPVVFVPFAWDRFVRDADIPLFHDADGRRVRNVGGPGAGFGADVDRHNSEEFGEDLRLLYVAMTRAQAQVTAWWAPGRNAEAAPLHRLLFSDDPARAIAERVTVPPETEALARIGSRAVDGALSVDAVETREPRRWTGGGAPPGALAAAVLGRTIDSSWTRTSYSALTRGVHDAAPPVGSEPEFDDTDDEPDTPAPDDLSDPALRAVASPMAELPGGTAFGTLVHAVLEQLDTGAPDIEVEVRTRVRDQHARFGPADVEPDDLAAALMTSLDTPLGPLAPTTTLAGIKPQDRLVELDFELPLRGGDRPNGVTLLRDIAQLLRRYLPVDDPLAPYANLLDDPMVGDAMLNGYLGGSIDVVLRVDGRYLVVDYKTNRLGEVDVPLTAWDYRPEAMAEAMLHAHYPLQALLYDVALHRFLRWRVPGYDPEQHLGGVLYLFLRGMCGPAVEAAGGSVPGVFSWRPDAALVVALSDLLATGVVA